MIGSSSDRYPAGLATRLFGLALLAFPRPLRAEYGREMRSAFTAAHAQRRRLGSGAALRYLRRALLDTLRAGLRERLGSGGLSATPSRSPLGRATRRTSDMLLHDLWTDLRLSARTLRKTPAFTFTVLAVLALGLGINGAIFSAIRATLLADPPYPEPDRLVLLDLRLEPAAGAEDATDAESLSAQRISAAPPTGRPFPWSYPKYEVLAATDGLAADPVAAYAIRTLTLTGRGEPVRLDGVEIVSPDYFRVLGVPPALGRDFAATDPEPERSLVISHELWRERFDADPEVTGATAVLNGEPMVVIGVAAPGFRGLTGRARAWISMPAVPVLDSTSLLGNFDGHWLQVVGRLRPDATVDTLTAQMDGVAQRVDETYPWTDPTETVRGGVRSLSEARRNPLAQRAVLVVGAAAGLVLLIACANLAGLMLARSLERRRENAVRLALGASRGRVARSVLVEAFLLAVTGSALGLLVAGRGIRALAAAWPSDFLDGGWNLRFVDGNSLALDATAVLYTIGLGVAAGLLFGMGPALRLARADSAVTSGTASAWATARAWWASAGSWWSARSRWRWCCWSAPGS